MKFIEFLYTPKGLEGCKVNKILPIDSIREVVKIGKECTLTLFSDEQQKYIEYDISEKEYLYLKNALCDVVVAKFQPREV